MRLPPTKKVISGILVGLISLFSLVIPARATEIAEASAPSNSIATNSDSTANKSLDSADLAPETAGNPQNSQVTQDAIGNMLLQSVSLMGIAYKWGGNTPNTGMDCSGFVRYVFNKSLGINLPRTAAEMAKVGKRVSINELQPGDLIFFNTRRGSNTHIGIYLGANKFIQSPRTGENIQISDLSGYWAQHFNGAKRVVQEDQDDNGNTQVQSFSNIRNEQLPVAHRSGTGSDGRHRHHRYPHSAHQLKKSTHNPKLKNLKKSHKKKSHNLA